MKQKAPFTPRNCVQTTIRGKAEWRCPDIQFNFLHNDLRRCSHSCEKRHIKYHHSHVYMYSQKEDLDFQRHILLK